jgi:hypothetical protein
MKCFRLAIYLGGMAFSVPHANITGSGMLRGITSLATIDGDANRGRHG